jgi:general stress protein 26
VSLNHASDSESKSPEAIADVLEIVRRSKYALLATIGVDGHTPRVRPVCAFLERDGDLSSLLIPTHARTRKIAEIEREPRIELCFVDDRHWQVRFDGVARGVADESVKLRLIETTLHPRLWRGFFPSAEKDENFILYRLVPEHCEWMKEWELDYRRI